MPRKRTPSKPLPERLADLPRRPELTIVGGMRTLPIYIREQGAATQPRLVLWLDAGGGYVLTFGLASPSATADGGVSEALQLLYHAIEQPGRAPGLPFFAAPAANPPALPGRVVVNDEALAQAVRAALTPLGVAVEYLAALPPFDEAFAALSQEMGADPDAEPPEPFSWGLDPDVLAPLYKAAASFYRRSPWSYLPDHPPVILTLGAHGPRDGVERLYASIMGLAGQVFGVAFYFTPEALDRIVAHGEARQSKPAANVSDEELSAAVELLRQKGAPVNDMPPEALRSLVASAMDEDTFSDEEYAEVRQLTEDSLVLFYDERDELDPTYADWIAARKLPTASNSAIPTFLAMGVGGEPTEPNAREAQALTLALEALNQFFSKYARQLDSYLAPRGTINYQAAVKMPAGMIPVGVSFTPPPSQRPQSFEDIVRLMAGVPMPDAAPERKQRATAAGHSTLYRFQVKLVGRPTVWRRIELRGDQTLDELHEAIQAAFGWDNSHLYAFFLSGKAWDENTEYDSPHADAIRRADKYRLEHLPLAAGQRILYIFDFGDELKHNVKLEAVVPGGVAKGVNYPRITERRGENAPQYPDIEDDEE